MWTFSTFLESTPIPVIVQSRTAAILSRSPGEKNSGKRERHQPKYDRPPDLGDGPANVSNVSPSDVKGHEVYQNIDVGQLQSYKVVD